MLVSVRPSAHLFCLFQFTQPSYSICGVELVGVGSLPVSNYKLYPDPSRPEFPPGGGVHN